MEGDSAITNSTRKPPHPRPTLPRQRQTAESNRIPDAMTMSLYLGRGQVSRGRTTIGADLNMAVSTQPFFHNDGDKEAVIQGIKNMQAALAGVKGLQWVRPLGNQTAEDYVNSLLVTANGRRSNHWMGESKLKQNPPHTSIMLFGLIVFLFCLGSSMGDIELLTCLN